MTPAKTDDDIGADLPCGLDAVGNDVLWRISDDLVEDRDVKAARRKSVSNRLDEAGPDETCIGNQQRLARLKPAGKNLSEALGATPGNLHGGNGAEFERVDGHMILPA